MTFNTFLQRIQRGLSTIELIHTSHSRWPLSPGVHSSLPPTIQISVLDSSYNPPTLAHLALANTLPPTSTGLSPAPSVPEFNARLLLLSVRNADKQLKPGDATYEQRMEMMVLLAHDLAHPQARGVPPTPTSPSESFINSNIAVAIIDEPTFVGKSALLLDFLRKRITEVNQPSGAVLLPSSPPTGSSPKLTFLMGTDTIVRFFAPRYYADEHAMKVSLHRFFSPEENGSRIICARRVSKGVSRAEEEMVESQIPDFVREIAPSDSITFTDIGEKECTYSSSEVREGIASRNERWKTMVPPSIQSYIAEHRLYAQS